MRILLYLLLYTIPLDFAEAQVEEVQAKLWTGQELSSGQSVLALNLIPSKSLLNKGVRAAVLKLFAAKSKKIYSLEYNMSMDYKRGGKFWILPIDSYKILQLIASTSNEILQFQGPHSKGFLITPESVSQVERWFVIEKSGHKLSLIPRPKKSRKQTSKTRLGKKVKKTPLLPSSRSKSVTNKVTSPPVLPSKGQVKGGTMAPPSLPSLKREPKLSKPTSEKPVKKLSGRKIQNDVITIPNRPQRTRPKINLKKNQTSREFKDIRAVYTSKQTISMFYKIDLKRYNLYAVKMQKVIDRENQKLRQCYSDSLEDRSDVKGSIHFKFLYSKSEKTFRNLKVVKQTVNDPKFVECVYWKIAALSFPIQVDIIGDLTFYYDLK